MPTSLKTNHKSYFYYPHALKAELSTLVNIHAWRNTKTKTGNHMAEICLNNDLLCKIFLTG